MVELVTVDDGSVQRSKWFWSRVTISTFFGFLTLALMALWVQSYWNYDVVRRIGLVSKFDVSSQSGVIRVSYIPEFRRMPAARWQWLRYDAEPVIRVFRVSYHRDSDEMQLELPYLLLPTAAIALGVLAWTPLSFSLRTMFIAATLVAVLLGLFIGVVR
jgi:hypothetical protein